MGHAAIVERADGLMLVRTSGFAAKHWGLATGISSGPDKTLLERYELMDEGYRLKLTYTVEDPAVLTAPATETLYYAKVHDYAFADEPPCDVGTARRHLEYE